MSVSGIRTLGLEIDFVIMLSDLLSYELDPRVKRGAELSRGGETGGKFDPLADRKLERPGGPDWREAGVDHVLHFPC